MMRHQDFKYRMAGKRIRTIIIGSRDRLARPDMRKGAVQGCSAGKLPKTSGSFSTEIKGLRRRAKGESRKRA
jgi:hypothetical protein